MANIYWSSEKKASQKEVQVHIMEKAEEFLGGKTNFGFRIDDGAAELWVECENPNSDITTYWHILDNKAKVLGWRTLIFKCPPGYLECFESQRNIRVIHLVKDEEINQI